MSAWSGARWIRECGEASDVGITGSDSKKERMPPFVGRRNPF